MPSAPRRIVLLVAALLVAAGVTSVSALATQTVKIDSRVTISSRPPAFHGRVKSSNNACEVHRTVQLFKQRQGTDKLLGKDKTNQHGRWVVKVTPLKSGAYYAKAKRRKEGTAGTIFVCRRDRSRTIAVD